ncbi:MAG: undecaprenyldiphospho-muramoylpentapeptide beta-N-acetylglucosaminyltransferase [Rhodothermales bacterium]
MNAPRILLAGGGTGGHAYPAIAIADAVRRKVPEAAIAFAGTKERIEWQAVPKAGYAIHPITVVAFHRNQMARNLLFPFKLLKGLFQSLRLVADFDADVAVGTGGFVSGPVLLAASLRGRPVVLQEQNAFAGVTNKLLARRAEKIYIAFEEAKRYLPAEKCILSGNPTRTELRQADRDEARRFFDVPPEAKLLLIFGGSLGSQGINEAVEAHLDSLLEDESTFVLWQTGALYYDRIRARIDEAGRPRLRLLKYIDRMDFAYAACDLALCRAGAITCSELMLTKTPAVLVPSPNVAEDHQTNNARSMADAGAAVLLPESEMSEKLPETVASLLADVRRRDEMAEAAGRLARPDAADEIAEGVLALAERYRANEENHAHSKPEA